jgi:type IV conjugative transfer system protein TraL
MDYEYKWTPDVDRPAVIGIFEIDEIIPSAMLFFILLVTGYIFLSLVTLIGVTTIISLIKKIIPRGSIRLILYALFPFYKLGGAPEYFKSEMHG